MPRNAFLSDLFGTLAQTVMRKKPAKQNTDAQNIEILTKILEAQFAADEMQSAAREDAGPSVVLTPVVPVVSPNNSSSWFGGAPRLPEGVAWPEIEGTPLCFVAQIDLSQLPQNIWSDVGPRSGQLAFFVHPDEIKVKVLHVDGELVRRVGPSPMDPKFAMSPSPGRNRRRKLVRDHFPEWPIRISGNVGELPSPPASDKDTKLNPGRPYTNKVLDLTNPAHRPINSETLEFLLELSGEALEQRLSAIKYYLAERKLREDVRSALSDLQADVEGSIERFKEISEALAPYQTSFDINGVIPHLEALNNLPIGRVHYQQNDDLGFAEIEVASAKLTEPHQAQFCHWTEDYLQNLIQHARYVYLETPEKLAPEAISYFEEIWKFNAEREFGGMSHPPKGYIYTPYGSRSPNEVLLELPTSVLLGWIWGDTYSIVLLIAREDLAKGNFENIMADITN